MGTKRKTPDTLDTMIEHVRYELLQIIEFARFGNGWCDFLRPDLGAFTQRSILESALIHFRCLIEFLGEHPTSDQVVARDYLPGWDWKISDELTRVGDLHGRVAHLGVVRESVATEGSFSWESWLIAEAPAVLRGFRDFPARLQTSSSPRYQLFLQPRHDLPEIELLPLLDSILGETQRT